VRNGFPVAPPASACPQTQRRRRPRRSSAWSTGFAKRNLLKGWPRPPVPEYLSLEAILGEEIHRACGERWSDQVGAERSAQAEADMVMREAGYY